MKRLFFYFFFVFSVAFMSPSIGSPDETMIKSAQDFLSSKDYTKALELYHNIESEQYQSTELYKNMAIAYAGLNNDGLAILYYEKALKLSPNNSVLKSDLDIIVKRNPELDEGVPPFILLKVWQSLTSLFNSTIWSVLSLLFFGLAGFILYKQLPTPGMTKKSYMYFGVFTALALLFVLASISAYQKQYNQNQMIVTEAAVVLKTGPDAESPDIENLPAGSKVVVNEQIGDWVQVNTSLGDVGWIKVDQAQKI
jgi:tetratricopeptide (TPR) repeat protein